MSSFSSPQELALRRPVDVNAEIATVGLLAPGISPVQRDTGSEVAQAFQLMQQAGNAFEAFAQFKVNGYQIEQRRLEAEAQEAERLAKYRAAYKKEAEQHQKDIGEQFLSDLFARDNTPERIQAIIDSTQPGSPEQIAREYVAREAADLPAAAREYAIRNAKAHTGVVDARLKQLRSMAAEDIMARRRGRLESSDPSEIPELVQATLSDKALAATQSQADILAKAVIPAMETQAKLGLTERFEALAKTLPDGYADKIEAGRLDIKAHRERQKKAAEEADRQAIFAQESSGYAAAKAQIEKSSLPPEKKDELAREMLSRAHRRHFEGVSSAIEAGVFKTQDDLEKFISAAGQRSQDDPLFINDENRDELRRKWPKAKEQNESVDRVGRFLAGQPVILTTSDSAAFDTAIRATGSIDANNQIVDPQRLGSLTANGILTPTTKQIIDSAMRDSDTLAGAGKALAAMKGSAAYVAFQSSLGDEAWMADLAAQYGPKITDKDSADRAMAAISEEAARREKTKPAAYKQRIISALGEKGRLKLADRVNADIRSFVTSTPQGAQYTFKSDPDLNIPGLDVHDAIEDLWFRQYEVHQRDPATAADRASADVKKMLPSMLDVVTWNGSAYPVLIQPDGPLGVRMSPEVQWSETAESELRGLLDAPLKEAGLTMDDVVSIEPYIDPLWNAANSPESDRMTWMVRVAPGDPLVTSSGIFLFKPSRNKAAEDRRADVLRKAAERDAYERKSAIPPRESAAWNILR